MTIDVEARFIDNVSGESKAASKAIEGIGKGADAAGKKLDGLGKKVSSAEKQVDGLGKKKAKPTLDADDSKLINKLKGADSKLNKLKNSKANVLLNAMDKASSVITKLLGKAKSFGGKTYSAILKLRDSNALATINKISAKAKSFAGKTWSAAVKIKDYATAPLTKLKNTLFSIKSLVLAITAGLAAKQLVVNPIGLADAYSSAKIGFQTLLGDTRGQQMMNDLDAFAKATPFNSSQVISQTQRMLAMGWDAENIIKDMETIGDAAAATGKGEQGLQQIVTALAQIKTKGKLSTEELNQLAEAGISAKRYIAEGLGYGSGDAGIAKMTKDLENGAISSGKALEALLGGMKEYQGMMDRTANETVSGLKSQLEDTFEINIARRWGQGLQDGAKEAFGSLVTLLDEADGALTKFGDTVYEVGSKISNWLAERLENAVKRVTEITGSFEWKDATLGEKLSMLWNGVIVDPLKEWWDGGGQQKTAETARKIGAWLGKTLSSIFKGLLGMTDVLDGGELESGAAGVAQSFAKGFVDNFDVSGITSKIVEAISNVWNALPTWGKILVGGYVGSKAIGGAASLVGGISNLVGTGGRLIGSASAGTGLLGFGANTAIKLGAGNLAGGASLGAGALSALGLGAVAGGATAALGVGHMINTGYLAYQGYKEGDRTKYLANSNRALFTGAGMAGGALVGLKAGAAIGSVGGPVGTLIGAGLGTAIGWFAGDKIAKNIEAAKFETEQMKEAVKDTNISSEELAATWEKAVWQKGEEIFGDIKLSAAEIAALSKQIVLGDKVDAMDKFASATKQAESSLASLKNSANALHMWSWKGGLGMKLSEQDQESYKEAINTYISDAKNYLESKHYEFTAAVDLIMDTSKGSTGESIIKGNDAFYASLEKKVNGYSDQLSKLMSSAFKNGRLDDMIDITIDGENFHVNEQEAIDMLTGKIADIMNKINKAENQAQLDLIEVKFKNSGLSQDSVNELQASIAEYKQTAIEQLDEADLKVMAGLNIQLDEAKAAGNSEKVAEIEAQIQEVLDSYGMSLKDLQLNVADFTLNLAVDTFSADDLLGEGAFEKINQVLSEAIKESIKPGQLTGEDIVKMLGADNIGPETAQLLADMLNNLDSFEFEIDANGNVKWKVNSEEDPVEMIKGELPETVETTVGVNISGEKNIQTTIDILDEDFGIPPEHAATVALLLTGSKEILNKIDVSKLAKEFGIPESQAKEIIEKLTGTKSIENRLTVLSSDFGIPDSISKTIKVNFTAIKGKITNALGNIFGARGGIFGGGSSSLNAFYRGGLAGADIPGYSDGGMVRGGAQLITVAEEGTPEMIIPMSSQRRGRALKLWAQAGHMLDVPGFARGGVIGGDGSQKEGIRFTTSGDDSVGGQSVVVEVGGVSVTIQVDATGHENIAEAIQEQSDEIVEVVSGILADALGAQFENTPTRGGAA